MDFNSFKEKVKDFIFLADEYMNVWDVWYFEGLSCTDEHIAKLELVMPYGDKNRTISIGINDEGKPAITVTANEYLDLDSVGLYVYLWNEAECELAINIRDRYKCL